MVGGWLVGCVGFVVGSLCLVGCVGFVGLVGLFCLVG